MSRTPQHQVSIGQRFEKLTVRHKAFFGWVVYCDCGQLKIVTGADLVRGKAKSCGCARRGKRLEPGVEATNYLFDKYQRQGRARGHEWGLSREQFETLIKQPCHYCGLPPSNCVRRKHDTLTYSGIDRKDNRTGYISSNTVPCCRVCNLLKKQTPYEQWVEYLNRIAGFRGVQKLGASV